MISSIALNITNIFLFHCRNKYAISFHFDFSMACFMVICKVETWGTFHYCLNFWHMQLNSSLITLTEDKNTQFFSSVCGRLVQINSESKLPYASPSCRIPLSPDRASRRMSISIMRWRKCMHTHTHTHTHTHLLIFYWRTVALQCCVSFCYTAKWNSSMFTYIPSFLDFLPI